MPRGETQLDSDLGVDTVEDPVADAEDDTDSGDGVRNRVRAGAGRLFSLRAFALALVATVAGAVFTGSAIPLGAIATLVGILVAAFVYGTVAGANRYLELAVAGALVGGASTVFGNLALSLLGPGVPIVALGVVAGGVSGALGHYFGRDLRDGLTRDI